MKSKNLFLLVLLLGNQPVHAVLKPKERLDYLAKFYQASNATLETFGAKHTKKMSNVEDVRLEADLKQLSMLKTLQQAARQVQGTEKAKIHHAWKHFAAPFLTQEYAPLAQLLQKESKKLFGVALGFLNKTNGLQEIDAMIQKMYTQNVPAELVQGFEEQLSPRTRQDFQCDVQKINTIKTLQNKQLKAGDPIAKQMIGETVLELGKLLNFSGVLKCIQHVQKCISLPEKEQDELASDWAKVKAIDELEAELASTPFKADLLKEAIDSLKSLIRHPDEVWSAHQRIKSSGAQNAQLQEQKMQSLPLAEQEDDIINRFEKTEFFPKEEDSSQQIQTEAQPSKVLRGQPKDVTKKGLSRSQKKKMRKNAVPPQEAVQEINQEVTQEIVQEINQEIVQEVNQKINQEVSQEIVQEVSQEAAQDVAREYEQAYKRAADLIAKVYASGKKIEKEDEGWAVYQALPADLQLAFDADWQKLESIKALREDKNSQAADWSDALIRGLTDLLVFRETLLPLEASEVQKTPVALDRVAEQEAALAKKSRKMGKKQALLKQKEMAAYAEDRKCAEKLIAKVYASGKKTADCEKIYQGLPEDLRLSVDADLKKLKTIRTLYQKKDKQNSRESETLIQELKDLVVFKKNLKLLDVLERQKEPVIIPEPILVQDDDDLDNAFDQLTLGTEMVGEAQLQSIIDVFVEEFNAASLQRSESLLRNAERDGVITEQESNILQTIIRECRCFNDRHVQHNDIFFPQDRIIFVKKLRDQAAKFSNQILRARLMSTFDSALQQAERDAEGANKIAAGIELRIKDLYPEILALVKYAHNDRIVECATRVDLAPEAALMLRQALQRLTNIAQNMQKVPGALDKQSFLIELEKQIRTFPLPQLRERLLLETSLGEYCPEQKQALEKVESVLELEVLERDILPLKVAPEEFDRMAGEALIHYYNDANGLQSLEKYEMTQEQREALEHDRKIIDSIKNSQEFYQNEDKRVGFLASYEIDFCQWALRRPACVNALLQSHIEASFNAQLEEAKKRQEKEATTLQALQERGEGIWMTLGTAWKDCVAKNVPNKPSASAIFSETAVLAAMRKHKLSADEQTMLSIVARRLQYLAEKIPEIKNAKGYKKFRILIDVHHKVMEIPLHLFTKNLCEYYAPKLGEARVALRKSNAELEEKLKTVCKALWKSYAPKTEALLSYDDSMMSKLSDVEKDDFNENLRILQDHVKAEGQFYAASYTIEEERDYLQYRLTLLEGKELFPQLKKRFCDAYRERINKIDRAMRGAQERDEQAERALELLQERDPTIWAPVAEIWKGFFAKNPVNKDQIPQAFSQGAIKTALKNVSLSDEEKPFLPILVEKLQEFAQKRCEAKNAKGYKKFQILQDVLYAVSEIPLSIFNSDLYHTFSAQLGQARVELKARNKALEEKVSAVCDALWKSYAPKENKPLSYDASLLPELSAEEKEDFEENLRIFQENVKIEGEFYAASDAQEEEAHYLTNRLRALEETEAFPALKQRFWESYYKRAPEFAKDNRVLGQKLAYVLDALIESYEPKTGKPLDYAHVQMPKLSEQEQHQWRDNVDYVQEIVKNEGKFYQSEHTEEEELKYLEDTLKQLEERNMFYALKQRFTEIYQTRLQCLQGQDLSEEQEQWVSYVLSRLFKTQSFNITLQSFEEKKQFLLNALFKGQSVEDSKNKSLDHIGRLYKNQPGVGLKEVEQKKKFLIDALFDSPMLKGAKNKKTLKYIVDEVDYFCDFIHHFRTQALKRIYDHAADIYLSDVQGNLFEGMDKLRYKDNFNGELYQKMKQDFSDMSQQALMSAYYVVEKVRNHDRLSTAAKKDVACDVIKKHDANEMLKIQKPITPKVWPEPITNVQQTVGTQIEEEELDRYDSMLKADQEGFYDYDRVILNGFLMHRKDQTVQTEEITEKDSPKKQKKIKEEEGQTVKQGQSVLIHDNASDEEDKSNQIEEEDLNTLKNSNKQ